MGCPVIKACWMSATFSCLFFPLLASWPFLCCCTAGDQQQKEISDIPRSQHPYLLVFLQRTLGFRLLCACVRVCSWFWPQNFYQEIIAFHLRFIVVLPVIEKKKIFFSAAFNLSALITSKWRDEYVKKMKCFLSLLTSILSYIG